MRRFLVILAILSALGYLHHHRQQASGYTRAPASGDGLIMYSLTTCGNCKVKSKQLRERGIAFTEYFIDREPARREELWSKLTASGYKRRSIGTPTFDAGGTMLPNNPPIAEIATALGIDTR